MNPDPLYALQAEMWLYGLTNIDRVDWAERVAIMVEGGIPEALAKPGAYWLIQKSYDWRPEWKRLGLDPGPPPPSVGGLSHGEVQEGLSIP